MRCNDPWQSRTLFSRPRLPLSLKQTAPTFLLLIQCRKLRANVRTDLLPTTNLRRASRPKGRPPLPRALAEQRDSHKKGKKGPLWERDTPSIFTFHPIHLSPFNIAVASFNPIFTDFFYSNSIEMSPNSRSIGSGSSGMAPESDGVPVENTEKYL